MQVGDLVRIKSNQKMTRNPGIVVQIYDFEFPFMRLSGDKGSKVRPMASVHWPHLERAEPMDHRQDNLEVISENR